MPISNWNTGAVRSREAMRLLADEFGADLDWNDVLIAHLDTGFTNHIVFNLASDRPALLVDRGINYVDTGVFGPRDPLNGGGGLVVTPGHGTRTLGALCGNLPGIYIGVCPTVPVVPYRVTNGVDIVPAVPPAILGYRHVGDSRYFGKPGQPPSRLSPNIFQKLWRTLRGLLRFVRTFKFQNIADHAMPVYVGKLQAWADVNIKETRERRAATADPEIKAGAKR